MNSSCVDLSHFYSADESDDHDDKNVEDTCCMTTVQAFTQCGDESDVDDDENVDVTSVHAFKCDDETGEKYCLAILK